MSLVRIRSCLSFLDPNQALRGDELAFVLSLWYFCARGRSFWPVDIIRIRLTEGAAADATVAPGSAPVTVCSALCKRRLDGFVQWKNLRESCDFEYLPDQPDRAAHTQRATAFSQFLCNGYE
jgi:hypothetical protein